jgi:hypothetical protein
VNVSCSSAMMNRNNIVIIDSTCGDGSCAYDGGDLASYFADLLSNSSETIEDECCTSGIINDTIQTCGNGKSCSKICGPNTGNSCVKTTIYKIFPRVRNCQGIHGDRRQEDMQLRHGY